MNQPQKDRRLYGAAFMTGVMLLGCAHASEGSPTTASNDAPAAAAPAGEDEASASVEEMHRHHHHGGVTGFIALSLDTLGADPAKQEAIEKIQATLRSKLAPARAAEGAVLLALANGVTAGKLDPIYDGVTIKNLAVAASEAQSASVDALNELHALLSPAERAALADKVRAHWEVWRKVNHEAAPDGKDAGSRLSSLADEVSLSSGQVEKMSADLGPAMAGLHEKFDPAEVDAHVDHFATAFASDSFDAKSLQGGPGINGQLATHGAARMVRFYETVTPQLTADQRTTLAADLREHFNHQQVTAEK